MIEVPKFYKKIFNYRPIVSIVLFFIAGTLFVSGFYIKSIFSLVLSAVMIIALIVTFVVKLVSAKRLKLFKLLSICVSFVVAGLITLTYFEVSNSSKTYSGEYYINGEVSDRTYINTSNKLVVTIEDVTAVSFENLKKTKISGKVRLYLTQDDLKTLDFMPGDAVSAKVNLSEVKLINGSRFNFSLYNRGIKTNAYGSETDIAKLDGRDNDIFNKFKIKVKETFDAHLSEDYSELGYTMLFGDKSGLNDEISAIYSESGTAHLLAVSGLHVGFVVTILSFILSFFKTSNRFKFWFISISIFLYAFLCGFSVSVTRAFIMTTVMLFSKLRDKEYDSLSSLSLAGLIILVINPLWIFDVGFQLSFCAVLGIILLSPVFNMFLSKVFHPKLAGAIAVSTSASIGIIPSMVATFSKFSIFSVITNVIVVPIASIAFMILFVSVILSIFMPSFGVFTYLFELLMRIVTGVSMLTGSTNVVANDADVVVFSLMLISTCLLASDVFNIKGKARVILASSFAVATTLLFVLLFV